MNFTYKQICKYSSWTLQEFTPTVKKIYQNLSPSKVAIYNSEYIGYILHTLIQNTYWLVVTVVHFTNGGGYIIDQGLSKSLSPCPKKVLRISYLLNFFIYGCMNHITESKESVNSKLGFPESGFFFLSCRADEEEEGGSIHFTYS